MDRKTFRALTNIMDVVAKTYEPGTRLEGDFLQVAAWLSEMEKEID
jgi:hypothetical protein